MSGSAEYSKDGSWVILTASSSPQRVATWAIIRTHPGSEAILHWGMAARTRIYPDTQLIINRASVSSDAQIGLEVSSGVITNEIVSYLGPKWDFEVEIPKKKMTASVRGSAFSVDDTAGVISALEHVVTLRDQDDEAVLVGEGNQRAFWATDRLGMLSVGDLSYRREVQNMLFAQYQQAQTDRPFWKRVIARIQTWCGLDPERHATLSIRPDFETAYWLISKDINGKISPYDALNLSVIFQDETLLAKSGERILAQTENTQIRSLYARDITFYLYYQSMDSLKRGNLPSIATLKILFTHTDLQKYLTFLPQYFASYAPNIRSTIVAGAAASPVWREFIRILDDGVLRSQDIAKIRSFFPASPFDLLR